MHSASIRTYGIRIALLWRAACVRLPLPLAGGEECRPRGGASLATTTARMLLPQHMLLRVLDAHPWAVALPCLVAH